MNIQKEIETKCEEGYNVLDYQNIEFKNKKDEFSLRDFFKQIFTINPKERISLAEMFVHSIFQNSESETTSDSGDDQLEQDVEWEMSKIKFI